MVVVPDSGVLWRGFGFCQFANFFGQFFFGRFFAGLERLLVEKDGARGIAGGLGGDVRIDALGIGLAVLAAAKLTGADLARAALALATAEPAKGRGVREELATPDGSLLLIDESYNANPASMRAALAVLGAAATGKNGRRIAVLGDMLELGPAAPTLHAEIVARSAMAP